MSIKRTIIATIATLALVATIAPVPASAVTIEELLAQITQLQAQLTALQGGSTTTTTGGTYSACVGVTFTRYLTVGSTGADVKCMQQILNSTGYTLATTGAGSPGNETTYFGPRTLGAVRAWQTAQGWVPANQLGPKSIALMNSMISSGTGTGTGTGTVITGDGLNVALSASSPAAGNIVAGQAQAALAKITFTNKDSSAVKVTKLKLTRGGVSSDSVLSNIYLFNGTTRLTDAAAISSGVISFNDSTGLFTIPAGSSVTITVAADIASGVSGNVYVTIESNENVTTNASSISGTFPVTGYTQTISTGASLATVNVLNNGTTGTVNPTGATLDPQSDYNVWYTNATVNISSGVVKLARLALREVGSVDYSDIQNFRLYVDGVQAGNAVASLDSNGYVTFDLSSSPIELKSGTRALKVLADIVNGSSKNFSFQLKTSADITLIDSQYGVAITPTSGASGATTFSALRSCYVSSSGGTYGCTIGSGAVTSAKTSDSPSGDVIKDASNQVLARWSMKANGERVKVESLKAYAALSTGNTTTATLRNAAFYLDGTQIGNTFNLSMTSATPSEVSLGSSMILEPATTYNLELRADIYDNYGANDLVAGQSITGYLVLGAGNAQGMTSSTTANVPTSTVYGNALTIATGSLSLSKYAAYTDKTTIAPQTGYKLAHFTLTGSTTEATNITGITTALTATLATNSSNLYVKLGSYTTTTKASPSTTNTWAVNYTLAAGTTVDVMVYGDILSTMTESGNASVLVEGTTASSATAVNTNSGTALDGQTITFGSGSATATISGSTPDAASVAGDQLVTAAKYKFTASNDSYTIKEAKLTVSGNNGATIQYATLSDGEKTYTASFDSGNNWFWFTGMSMPVAADSTKTLTAQLMLTSPSTNGSVITTGKNVALTMSYVKALNSQGVVKDSDSGIALSSAAGNNMYVYKSIPTFTVGTVTGQGTNLSSGSTTTLYNFTVGADAKGDIAMKQLKFAVAVTNTADPASNNLKQFKFFRGSTDITDSVSITTTAGVSLEESTTIGTGTVVVTFTNEETVAANSTYSYSLKATPTNFGTSTGGNDSVSTYLVGDGTTPSTVHYLYADANGIYQLSTAGAASGAADKNVIWSDVSATGSDATNTSVVGHSYDAAGSSDWFSGGLIKNLTLDSIGITAQ